MRDRGPSATTSPTGSGAPGDRSASRVRTRSTALLIAMRVGYAYNWFDIGPALPRIGSTFAVGPVEWGLLIGAFLVGAGLFQVPAGLLARRHGARSLALGGAGLLAAAAAIGAFAPSFAVLLVSRVVAGAGAGLFFSPAIGLVASLYPPGERGVPVGGFSSAFSAGAALGIYGTALLVPLVDWRAALALGAVGLGAVTLAALLAIPRSQGAPPPERARDGAPGLPRAFVHPAVWAIGLAFVGFEGATFASGQFVVPFGEEVRRWAPALAGAIGTAFVLPSVLGGPIGGSVAERNRHHRTQLAGMTLVGAGALSLLPWAGPSGAAAVGSVFSFAYGFVYAVMYVVPHLWKDLPAREIPLAIGLFNAVQLTGGAAVAYLFGWVVGNFSYTAAWLFAAGLQAASLVALLLWGGAGRPASAGSGPPARRGR